MRFLSVCSGIEAAILVGKAEAMGVMTCTRCGASTDWLIFDTVTEAKRGVPCEACNKPQA